MVQEMSSSSQTCQQSTAIISFKAEGCIGGDGAWEHPPVIFDFIIFCRHTVKDLQDDLKQLKRVWGDNSG